LANPIAVHANPIAIHATTPNVIGRSVELEDIPPELLASTQVKSSWRHCRIQTYWISNSNSSQTTATTTKLVRM
jgi:hypothetical protein